MSLNKLFGRMLIGLRVASLSLVGLSLIGLSSASLSSAHAADAVVQKIKVHSLAIAGNLEGNIADRDVIMVLPGSYDEDSTRRYPVAYFLHGFFLNLQQIDGLAHFGEAMTQVMAQTGKEFILVAPDSHTKHAGSMYSNSVAVGNFEGFVAHDLVAYVDSHYRTIARADARGLGGHSMGGYGTLKIAMKYPGIFNSVYAMSACCLSARQVNLEADVKVEALSMADALKADFGTRAALASAAAWSPNPNNPPFYFDWLTKDGAAQPAILAQWAANAPNALLPQYVSSLRNLRAFALEIGDKDGLIRDNAIMHDLLGQFGVAHDYIVFDGGHADKFAERVRDHALMFFAEHLATSR